MRQTNLLKIINISNVFNTAFQISNAFNHCNTNTKSAINNDTSNCNNTNPDLYDIFYTTASTVTTTPLKNKNTIFSTLSAQQALLFVQNGTTYSDGIHMYDNLLNGKDITHHIQLNKILGKNVKDDISDFLGDKYSEIVIANSLWWKNEDIDSDYYTKMSELGTLQKTNNILADVNGWVSSKTNGMIDKILDHDDPDIRVVILNTIYFKGHWITEFEAKKTVQRPFYTGQNNSITKDFMCMNDKCKLLQSDNHDVLCKKYANGFYMIFIKNHDDNNYDLPSLSQKQLIDYWKNSRVENVYIEIPRFKIEATHDLKALISHAYPSIDMNHICDKIKKDFKVSKILQKAVIEVDEIGTKAAAATMVMAKESAMMTSPKSYTFKANKKFHFNLVKINDSDPDGEPIIIFSGTVAE